MRDTLFAALNCAIAIINLRALAYEGLIVWAAIHFCNKFW